MDITKENIRKLIIKKYYCDCVGWVIGVGQITAISLYCHNRPASPKYTAKAFSYCPWCGKAVQEVV